MIYLELFLAFLKIGAFSFGGGMSMISLMQDVVFSNGWLTEGELLQIVAIAESTPGPIAVNLATFIGSTQGGFIGALLATLGIVLPSFVIILIIAAFVKNLIKYELTKEILTAIRPCVVGMIFAVLVSMGALVLLGTKSIGTPMNLDFVGILLFFFVLLSSSLYKRLFKKAPSPILVILLCAVVGILAY